MSIQKHTAYNLLGAILPIGLSLITIPIYISLIGEARYGVIAIAWLLLGYFGLFDLGLGRATAQRIATLSDACPEQLATTFWTALVINLSFGAIGGLIIWPVAIYFFGQIFSVDAALRVELLAAIPWLVLAVPLATLSGILSGALEGRAQFLELNLISVLSSAMIQLLPLTMAWLYSSSLTWLLPAVILARVIILILLFCRCRIHVFYGLAAKVSPKLIKGLLKFGGWVTVTSIVGPMMVILDRFVIGSTLGAKAVTYYSVPFQLAERSTILPGALTTALFPRLAAAGTNEARRLAAMAISSLSVIMTPLILLGLLLIEPFLKWWLNPDFGIKAGFTAQILLLGFWINSFARIPYAQLQAAGLPHVVAKCHLGELIPYLVLLYIGLNYWGLPGAAVVFGLRAFVDCALLLWFAGNLAIGFKTLFVPSLLLLAGLVIASELLIGSFLWWLAASGLMLLSLGWSWREASPEFRRFTLLALHKFSIN